MTSYALRWDYGLEHRRIDVARFGVVVDADEKDGKRAVRIHSGVVASAALLQRGLG